MSKYGLEFIATPYKRNLKFVEGLKKYLKRQLMLQLELSFEKLVDAALHLESVEMEHSDDGGVGSTNPTKKRFPPGKSGSSFQHKKKKAISSSSQPQTQSQTPAQPSGTRPPKKCFNCGSPDHFIRECPKPLYCTFCKKEGHRISACPIAPASAKPGRLNAAKAPTTSAQPKGTHPSVLEGSILFHGRSFRVLLIRVSLTHSYQRN